MPIEPKRRTPMVHYCGSSSVPSLPSRPPSPSIQPARHRRARTFRQNCAGEISGEFGGTTELNLVPGTAVFPVSCPAVSGKSKQAIVSLTSQMRNQIFQIFAGLAERRRQTRRDRRDYTICLAGLLILVLTPSSATKPRALVSNLYFATREPSHRFGLTTIRLLRSD